MTGFYKSFKGNISEKQSLIAILAMLGSTLCYLLGDTIVKLATGSIPVPQIIFIRGVIAALLVAIACAAFGVLRYWRQMFTPLVMTRGLLDSTTTLLFTNALAHMRIAEATAIINAVPIVGALLAILVLKEKVGTARWIAILGGFAGVLLVMRPDPGGFNYYSLLAVAAMFIIAVREIVTRRIPVEAPALIVTLFSTLAVSTVGGMVSVTAGYWTPVSTEDILFIGCASVFLFGAYYFAVVSLRLGEVSLVGPFRYMIVFWGLVVGYLVWGDIPDWIVAIGMVLIVASGLLVLRQQLSGGSGRR